MYIDEKEKTQAEIFFLKKKTYGKHGKNKQILKK